MTTADPPEDDRPWPEQAVDFAAPAPPPRYQANGGAAPSPLEARLVTAGPDWLTVAPEPRQYLARDTRTGRGAIDQTGVALLVSAGGAGKSYATIALALAVATGTPWLGVLQPERAGRVLMVSAEESAAEIRRRLYHAGNAAHLPGLPAGYIDVLDVHDLHLPLLDAEGRPTPNAVALVELVRARGPYALVVADPLARLAGANIDADNAAACALITTLEAVSSAAIGLVLAPHHTSGWSRRAGTHDATAVRGATGLGDSARLVLSLAVEELRHDDPDDTAHLGEIVTLRRVKANHVARWDPIELRRGEHGELLPLDAPDQARVVEARRRDDSGAARQDHQASREAEEDAAVLAALAGGVELPWRQLVERVQALARCGTGRAGVAVARCEARLCVKPGPRHGPNPTRIYSIT